MFPFDELEFPETERNRGHEFRSGDLVGKRPVQLIQKRSHFVHDARFLHEKLLIGHEPDFVRRE
jgi:hypothetical protein